MLEDFTISNETARGQTMLMRVAGRLDAKTAPKLMERCAVVRTAGYNLVLNLAAVTFVASSGVGALLALVEQFKGTPRSVRIVSPSSAVESVIKLLNLDQFLTIDPTEEQALSALDRDGTGLARAS